MATDDACDRIPKKGGSSAADNERAEQPSDSSHAKDDLLEDHEANPTEEGTSTPPPEKQSTVMDEEGIFASRKRYCLSDIEGSTKRRKGADGSVKDMGTR